MYVHNIHWALQTLKQATPTRSAWFWCATLRQSNGQRQVKIQMSGNFFHSTHLLSAKNYNFFLGSLSLFTNFSTILFKVNLSLSVHQFYISWLNNSCHHSCNSCLTKYIMTLNVKWCQILSANTNKTKKNIFWLLQAKTSVGKCGTANSLWYSIHQMLPCSYDCDWCLIGHPREPDRNLARKRNMVLNRSMILRNLARKRNMVLNRSMILSKDIKLCFLQIHSRQCAFFCLNFTAECSISQISFW